MRPSQLYLETTVWNFFFADDAPEKRDMTRQFFLKIESGYFLVNISPVVIDEISRAEHHNPAKLETFLYSFAV